MVCESTPFVQPDMTGKGQCKADILGKILDKDNLNRAYKRVKENKGASGADGMTIEAHFQG